MKSFFSIFLCVILTSSGIVSGQKGRNATAGDVALKPRLVVLTDISSWEPDDHESLIRLLVHADMYEIEGIVITTGWSIGDVNEVKRFKDIALGVIDAYEKDLPKLMKRSNQNGFLQDDAPQEIGYWPSAGYLRDRTMFGSMHRGLKFLGEGNDSDGSELIIQLADEQDARPIWVTFWGGGNTLAQSIWKVQQTRSAKELKVFLNKVRAYAITDQDRDQKTPFEISAHAWMRENFSDDLLFIWDECAWGIQNGTGKANWAEYEKHIQKQGNLGTDYPKYKWGVEGDTPSFLHLMPNGLNNPDVPTQAGWGGYSVWGQGEDNKGYSWVNYTGDAYNACKKYETHFYPATFNNFVARMDWARDGAGNRNPIVVVDGNKGIDILRRKVSRGATLILDASASSDPDGDALKYSWWIQPEAGTYSGEVRISGSDRSIATIEVPADAVRKDFHVICEVSDAGSPELTSYRRIIVEVDD